MLIGIQNIDINHSKWDQLSTCVGSIKEIPVTGGNRNQVCLN